MLHLTSQSKILLAVSPVDFRKQIDSLTAICREKFHRSPNDGVMYVFINRARTMIKILYYEENGYWLAAKRLSRGKYTHWPKSGEELQWFMAHELTSIRNRTLAFKQ